MNGFFEIAAVENEHIFWQLGNYYTYNLKVQLFTYSYEKFNTGNPVFDDSLQPIPNNEFELNTALNRKIPSSGLIDTVEKNPFGGL